MFCKPVKNPRLALDSGIPPTLNRSLVTETPTTLSLLPDAYEDGAEFNFQYSDGVTTDSALYVARHEILSPSLESTDTSGLPPYQPALMSNDDQPAASIFGPSDQVAGARTFVAQSYPRSLDYEGLQYQQVAPMAHPQFQLQQLQLQQQQHLQQRLQQQLQQQQLQLLQLQLQQLPAQLGQYTVQLPLHLQLHFPQQAYQQPSHGCVDAHPIFQDSLVLSSSPFPMARDNFHSQSVVENNHSRSTSVPSTHGDEAEGMSLDSVFLRSFSASDSHPQSNFILPRSQMSCSSSPPLLGSDFEVHQETLDAISLTEPVSPQPAALLQPKKKRVRMRRASATLLYPGGEHRHGVDCHSSTFPRFLPARPISQGKSTPMAVGPLTSNPEALEVATPVLKRPRSSSVGAVPCPQCNKRFSRKNNVDMHVKRVHDGERPFICGWAYCTKSFAAKGDFLKHVRLHTGERPYTCPHIGCSEAYSRSEPRDRHHDREHPGCDGGDNCVLESLKQLTTEE